MIESVAYEIIKEEGIKEGIEKGKLDVSKEMVIEVLEEKFDVISVRLVEKINEIKNAVVLKGLLRDIIWTCVRK